MVKADDDLCSSKNKKLVKWVRTPAPDTRWLLIDDCFHPTHPPSCAPWMTYLSVEGSGRKKNYHWKWRAGCFIFFPFCSRFCLDRNWIFVSDRFQIFLRQHLPHGVVQLEQLHPVRVLGQVQRTVGSNHVPNRLNKKKVFYFVAEWKCFWVAQSSKNHNHNREF